jgi:hypothetical protein
VFAHYLARAGGLAWDTLGAGVVCAPPRFSATDMDVGGKGVIGVIGVIGLAMPGPGPRRITGDKGPDHSHTYTCAQYR